MSSLLVFLTPLVLATGKEGQREAQRGVRIGGGGGFRRGSEGGWGKGDQFLVDHKETSGPPNGLMSYETMLCDQIR